MRKKILKSSIITLFGTALLAGSAFGAAFNDRPTSVNDTLGEQSLQTILDGIAGVGVIDAVDDQREEAVWVRSGDFDSLAVTVALYTDLELGIYSFSDPSKSYTFSNLDAAGDVVSFNFKDNDLYVNNIFAVDAFGEAFGFFVTYGNNDYYTEDSKNGGEARALVYNLNGIDYTLAGFNGVGEIDDWLLAFNEGTDGADFNEGVYFIEDISPVPEPATMLLFGAGIAGLAGVARRKKK